MNILTNILFQDCTVQCVYITLFNLQGSLNYANIKKGTERNCYDFNQFLMFVLL